MLLNESHIGQKFRLPYWKTDGSWVDYFILEEIRGSWVHGKSVPKFGMSPANLGGLLNNSFNCWLNGDAWIRYQDPDTLVTLVEAIESERPFQHEFEMNKDFWLEFRNGKFVQESIGHGKTIRPVGLSDMKDKYRIKPLSQPVLVDKAKIQSVYNKWCDLSSREVVWDASDFFTFLNKELGL